MKSNRWYFVGQTEPQGNGTDGAATDDDFLSRERALLGDDAAQFAGSSDNTRTSATVQDDDDLLGGDDSYGGGSYSNGANAGEEDVTDFESSFPAIDTRNEVWYTCCEASSCQITSV